MIDIEGLATTPDAVILTIAAQSFNPFGKGYYDNRFFYARVTLESQEDRAINEATVEWWATQKEAQLEAFNENNRISLEDALDGLHKIAWQHDFIWANGPTYDINILEHAYRSKNKKQPWQYYKIRDARSIYSLYPGLAKPATSHHALEDCKRQIDMLQSTFKYLNVTEIR
jgi:hypothetical protein